MSDPLYGWDLTFKTIDKDINKKSDVLIVFTHFNLTKRGFRCIGIGDDRTLAGNEDASELLPSAWNAGQQYSLRYIYKDKLYIFKGIISDGNLIINLMKAEDLSVSSLAFNIDDTVKGQSGPLSTILPEYKELMYKITRDLIDTITEKATTTGQTQTRETQEERHPLLEDPHPRANLPPQQGPFSPWSEADPMRIGRSDLDPFAPGGGGGGMIFDPFSGRHGPFNPGQGVPGGLPRGAVPPGARFDPFGPPGFEPLPRRRPPPDNDEFMPPGDMFM